VVRSRTGNARRLAPKEPAHAEAADSGSRFDADASLPRTQFVMLAAVVGLALGAGVIYIDAGSWNQATKSFAKSSAFQFWVGLLAAQTMLWTLALPPLLSLFRRQWRARRLGALRREVVPSALVLSSLVAALVILPRLTQKLPDFMPHRALKVDVLTGLALIVALLASMSIWLIRSRAETLQGAQPINKHTLDTFSRMRSDLERLLGFLGLVIGLAVLASAALRHVALLADEKAAFALPGNKKVDFPADTVVLYGLVLSLILALVYLPSYLTLQQTGQRLRDRIQPLPEPDDPQFEAHLAKRKAIDELLGLQVSASASFRAGVFILTPLLGSLTSLLPKLGG
jgi:hypothetical protein